MIEVSRANRVRVQLHATKVHNPGETGDLIHHHFVCGATGREGQGHRPHPVREITGGALLIERLSPRAIYKAFEDHGTIHDAAQRTWRDGKEVAHDVQLCQLDAL